MRTDYTHFKDIDFLEDDFFIESMIFPTKSSELFWSTLIDSKIFNINEFISANMLLDTIRKSHNDEPKDYKEQLWKRIDSSRKTLENKKERIILYKILSITACCAIIVGLTLTLLFKKNEIFRPQDTEIDFKQFQSFQQQESNVEIRITSENSQVVIDGEEADIKYDSLGLLTVNNRDVNQGVINQTETKPSHYQLYVPYGKRALLTLSDGSTLWVNAGTAVIYPATFTDNKREIYIDGEVYAEVQRDENRSFLVKTEQMEIEVLGTAFNLSAYKKDTLKRVVLVNGSVDVRLGNVNTRLIPNQSYMHTPQGSRVETVNAEIYTSWRDGIYIFQDEPIEIILLKLARFYNATMIIPPQSSGTRCSGKLELKEDLSHLLNHLSQIASFNFGIKENECWILFNQ